MNFDVLMALNYAGVFVFAVSGGLVAIRHRMDLFGVCVIALLPALGGGTLRDVLLAQPVFWLDDLLSFGLAGAGGLAAFLLGGRWRKIRLLIWADAAGLSVFAVLGAAKTLDAGYGPMIAVLMGAVTATAGGLLRDIVCNEPPLLLREEVYATAALVGAALYVAAVRFEVPGPYASLLGVSITFIVRWCAIRFNLSLPKRAG